MDWNNALFGIAVVFIIYLYWSAITFAVTSILARKTAEQKVIAELVKYREGLVIASLAFRVYAEGVKKKHGTDSLDDAEIFNEAERTVFESLRMVTGDQALSETT